MPWTYSHVIVMSWGHSVLEAVYSHWEMMCRKLRHGGLNISMQEAAVWWFKH